MVLTSCGTIMKAGRQEHAVSKQACISATNTAHFKQTPVDYVTIDINCSNTSFLSNVWCRNTCMLLAFVCIIEFEGN
jgi:hypothetical protein